MTQSTSTPAHIGNATKEIGDIWIRGDHTSPWKRTVDLYNLVQQLCDRPAYFWHNYKFDVLLFNDYAAERDKTLAEVSGTCISKYVRMLLTTGAVKPQAFCDTRP